MTVGQMKNQLKPYSDQIEFQVRCEWMDAEPAGNVFAPKLVVQEMDPDTAEYIAFLECDQEPE